MIEAQGLKVGNMKPADSPTVPANVVIGTDPQAQTAVDRGSPVDINFSSGKVNVPDVTGKTLSEAKKLLVGLKVGTTYVNDPNVPSGQVISQDLTAGASADQHSKITLTVSSGPAATPTPSNSPTVTPTPSASASASSTATAT